MLRHQLLAFAIGCALALPAAAAGEAINSRAPINRDGKLDVKNVRGWVHVTAWDKNEIEVTGTLGEGSKFGFDGSPASMSVRIDSSDSHSWFNWGGNGPREDTRLEIKVPRAVEPQINVVSADVEIRGLEGSREINVEAVSGDIKIDARAGRLEIQSVSGDLRVEGASERGTFESVSGDVQVKGVSGEVSVEAVSGDARIEAGGPVKEFKGHTVSGDITLTAVLAPHARVKTESMSGDVTLVLPGDVSAALEAKTFSGNIHSAFGKVDREEFGSGQKLRTTAGAGDAQIDVETFSGDVTIDKR
jgi:DUF4097 and DUF4098 domain-containing protein YvlB